VNEYAASMSWPGKAARDHHPGIGGQGQPVTAAPAQRGDGHPVGDPARGVDPAEPVDQVGGM
jgi:hypothetical protein